MNARVSAEDLSGVGYDHVVLATGIAPRMPDVPGINHEKVLTYLDVLLHNKPVGKKVAVIGAGGIGFDVSEFLTHGGKPTSLDAEAFFQEWGIDSELNARGGVEGVSPAPDASPREVYLLQRKDSKMGQNLGKTTGWIHRTSLKNKGVKMLNLVKYHKIDDDGLHISRDEQKMALDVDNVIVCVGQEPLRELQKSLVAAGVHVSLIGGADEARELDAKRAIDQGSRLAAEI